MGARGSTAIHPTHIPVINEVFTPTRAEIDHAVALVECLAEAYAKGDAAVIFDGGMIDRAHARVANILLAEARECGLEVPDVPWYDEWAE
jgi:citrate lyase subunit beta / citryl-CoA lyase